jgi:hypothetical protein
VVRKNSIWARKTMEMLSLSSLVSSPVGCRNPGAKRPDHTVLAKIASPLTSVVQF